MNFKNEKNFIFLSLGIVLIFFLSVAYFLKRKSAHKRRFVTRNHLLRGSGLQVLGIILSTTLFIMQLIDARAFLVMASMILTTYMKI